MTTATTPRKAKARLNGDGSIYQTAEGRWRGAITWADPITHERRRKVVSGKDRDDVRVKLTALLANLDKGIKPTSAMLLSEFLGVGPKDGKPATGWLGTKWSKKPATARMYEQCVRLYLMPHLGGLRLDQLTVQHVQRMTAGMMAKGLSPRTASHARVVLRTALADALEAELVTRNVAASRAAAVTQVGTTALKYLDTDQVRTFIEKNGTDHPLYVVALLTGMRQGELLGLTWDSLTANTITVGRQMARDAKGGYSLATTKTGKSRTITMSSRVRAALVAQKRVQEAQEARCGSKWANDAGLVFTDAVGRPLRGDSVNHQWHRLLEAAGLPSIPFHGSRHSAATAALTAGIPLRLVADMLGHSTITLTANLYGHVAPESRDEVAAAMDRVFG